MASRYNNRKIILSEQTLSIGKLLPGMIVTFNYSESGVMDPRPVLLFLHRDKVIEVKKGKVDAYENLLSLKENYFRIQIANPKKRSPLTTKRFYSDVVGADNVFKQAYRSYKTTKLTALKVTNIKLDMVGISED